MMLQLINSINNTVKKILRQSLELDLLYPELTNAINEKNLMLHEFTSYITISRPYKIKVILSVESGLTEFIRTRFFNNRIEKNQDNFYAESTINEVLNIIIGNSTEILSIIGTPIIFDVPKSIDLNSNIRKMAKNCGWSTGFKTKVGNFIIYYLYDIENNSPNKDSEHTAQSTNIIFSIPDPENITYKSFDTQINA